ncbi:MAG: helix-turn-helix domain-containing protein [Bauldia sp.]|nr:helix-turn-helix domain-containing protein [Bauldia sp.]
MNALDPHRFPVPRDGTMTITFDDHRFCAGRVSEVEVMSAPHRHSQFEINYVLNGEMTYWFDGREVRLRSRQVGLFWGMVPHRTVGHLPGTRFVCLYVPVALFMAAPLSEPLKSALFNGAFAAAVGGYESDPAQFVQWREDLLGEDGRLEAIVREELGARLRRLDHDGWSDLRQAAPLPLARMRGGRARYDLVEAMLRFIGEHSPEDISVSDVARAAALHPNYAMTLFKKSLSLTILEYITRCRLDNAQARLVTTNLSVAEIAFASGFGSLSRFYEAFHDRFAMSPARFRQWQREGMASSSAPDRKQSTPPRRAGSVEMKKMPGRGPGLDDAGHERNRARRA